MGKGRSSCGSDDGKQGKVVLEEEHVFWFCLLLRGAFGWAEA